MPNSTSAGPLVFHCHASAGVSFRKPQWSIEHCAVDCDGSRDVPFMSFGTLHDIAAKLWMSGADDFAGTRRTSLIRKVERAQLLFAPDTVKFSLTNGF